MKATFRKIVKALARNAILCAAAFLSTIALEATPVSANPTGGQVSAGSATISSSGTTLNVNQTTNRAVIDWRGFDIAAGETTNFIQPSSSSMTLNRVNSGSPSQIFGHLNANGNIEIINPSGVLFGAGSHVDVNGLVATTANISNQAFMNGGPLAFNQPGDPNASIINNGMITAADAGLIGLVAPNVINNGIITAKLGTVHLASADSFTLDLYGDGLLNFAVSPSVQKQLVQNEGTISAAGGKINLTAAAGSNVVDSLIKVSGKLSAPAVSQKGGHIYIYAKGGKTTVDGNIDASGNGAGQTGGDISVLGDNVDVKNSAVIDASGDAGGGAIKIGGDFHGAGTTPTALNTTVESGAQISANANTTGNGGSVVVWSNDETQFFGSISATGGAQSGNGGYVETSGHQLLSFDGTVNLLAPHGATGSLLLDPENVTITNNASVTDSCSSGTCTPTADTSYLNVTTLNNALASSNVTVTTGATGSQTGNITVNGTADAGGAVAINWSTGNLLTLSAAGNIIIDSGATITNTYNVVNGTFGISTIPVVLALRADSGSVNGKATAAGSSYGVTNNGTINMSGSSGAVSIFNDWNFTPVNGTQTANGSWTQATYAPNYAVANQFTTYRLINSTADLTAVGANGTTLGYTYALGKNIAGGGAAFNSNTPLGTFTGTLDGQYCALTGGSVCGISGFTMNYTGTYPGLIAINTGTIRNLSLGLNLTVANTGNTDAGTLAGYNSGTIANVAVTGPLNFSTTVSGTAASTFLIGGLTGYDTASGLIVNSSYSGDVTFTYAGTTSGTSTLVMGGLVGYNAGTAANHFSGSYSTGGTVTAQYSQTACGGGPCSGNVTGQLGGLSGSNDTVVINAYSTDNVSDSLSGTHYDGGLVGFGRSGSISNSHATGTVQYTGSGTNDSGGLAAYSAGSISNSYATGNVTVTATAANNAGGLVGYNVGSISNSYATCNISETLNANASGILGGLVGSNSGSIAGSYTTTGSVTGTTITGGSATSGFYLGGIAGSNNGTISSSYTTEDVAYYYQGNSTGSPHDYEGGFVGYNGNGGSIQTSYSSGSVNALYSNGYSGGSNIVRIGGFAGANGIGTAGTIQTSYETGSVNVNLTYGGTGYIREGGFVGENDSTSATLVSDSYATGSVTISQLNGATAGAFVGTNGATGTTLNNVYATGNVINTAAGYTSGGLVGSSSTAVAANNYWDAGTTGQTSSSNGGTSQTTAQLQSALPTGFSSSTWGIIAGTSYPYLLWQVSGTPQVVSGTAYSDRGVTAIASGTVSGLLNGTALNGGKPVSTGANGYYYFLLPSGGLNGTGSELLTYLTGSTKGNTLDDGISGSTTGLNIWGNTLRLVSATGTPSSLAGGLATAMGANSGSNFLGTGSTTGGIDSIITTAGDIDLASSINWSNSNELVLSAHNNVYIDSGITITNTYNTVNGTFAAGTMPVVLALRADSGSVNGNATAAGSSYGVTNNGTIDMSGSSGAVSIFNDWNFTPVNGTQTANGSWSQATYAPNYAVANQFTTYKLVNSAADLAYIGTNGTTLGYTYALGTNINGGGAAFNGNTPLGTFTGTLDGQYCVLVGGSVCGVSGFTMNYTGIYSGLFSMNSGTLRNLSLGLNLTAAYSNNSEAGTLVGYNSGTIANVASTGSVNYSTTVGGSLAPFLVVGGLTGYNATPGIVINSSYSGGITYTYAGTTSGTSTAIVGGLVGFNSSTATNAISGSYASGGTIIAQYSQTGCGGGACSGNVTGQIGGLVGNNSLIDNSYATDGITDSLTGSAQYVGGMVGYGGNGSVNNSYATGNIQYTGSATTDTGGLVGYNGGSGSVSNSYATGNLNINSTAAGNAIGGLIGYNSGSISSSYATGNVQDTYGGTSSASVGGLTGTSYGSITNSYATAGTVTALNTASGSNSDTFYLGGIAGYNGGTISGSYSTEAIINNYQADAAATGTFTDWQGGLVGFNANLIQTSYATGNVTAQYSNGYSGGINVDRIGGLVGGNGSNSAGTIQTSYSTGNVNVSLTAGTGSIRVGGFLGQNASNSAIEVADSYSTGSVTVSQLTNAMVGSFVGNNGGTGTTTITDVYATGRVVNLAGSYTAGGIAGNSSVAIGGGNNYWDAGTTGQTTTSNGGTSQTTAQLQAALPTGFSSSTWGIVAGASYPYLLWQNPSGTPQVVSGTAYSDRGTTALAGANVGIVTNGILGSLIGNTVTTGANGYYYFLLAPGTISGSGTNVLTYLTSGGAGSTLADAATSSVGGVNIYGNNTLRILPKSTSISFATDFSSAIGANSSANFLATVASNTLTLTAGDTLDILGNSGALALSQSASTSTGSIYISGVTALTQTSGGLTAANMSASASSISLNQSNAIGTAAFSAAGNITFNDTTDLTLGTVNGLSGIADSAPGTASITTTGNMTVSQALNGSNGNALNINLSAGGYISDTAGINTYGGNLVMRSNNADVATASTTIAAIDVEGTTLQTGGGYMIFGGGSASDSNGNPTGYAYGAGYRGIFFLNDTINAGGGSISALGRTASLSAAAYFLVDTITTSGNSGTITLQALTSTSANGMALGQSNISTTSGNINITGSAVINNILFTFGNSNIYSTSGNINLTGTGAGNSTGMYFTSGITNKIYSTSGNITLNGAGAGSGADYQFLGTQYIGTDNAATTTSGNITLNGSGLSSVALGTTTKIATSGSGNVTLYANALSAGAANTVSAGGILTMAPYTNVSMGVGTAAGGTLNLTDTTLGDFSAGSYVFGAATVGNGTTSTGNMTINTANSFAGKTVSFVSGGNMAVSGALTAGTANFTDSGALTQTAAITATNLSASANSITLGQNNAVGTAAFSAAGNITFNDTGNLTLGTVNGLSGIADSAAGTASITTTGNLTASQALNGSSGNALNINLSAGGYISDTANINTYGGNLVTRSNNADVATTSTSVSAIDVENAAIQTAGGYIIFGGGSASDVNGNPTGYAYASGYRGFYFFNDTIDAGSGSISLLGKSSKAGLTGTYLNSSTFTTSGSSPTSSITIQGLSTASNGMTVTGDTFSTTSGNINITGTGTNAGYDLYLQSGNDNIYTTSGNISLTGNDLGAANANGIYFAAGNTYKIYSTSGNIALNGSGTGTGADLKFVGTEYIGTNNTGTTTTGNVTLSANGVGGITLTSGTHIAASGAGNITLNAGTGAFVNNIGTNALTLGTGRWLIYSATPGADTFGNLDSGNTAIWNTTYGGTISQSGNRYVFAYQPTVTFTSTNDSKTYGSAISVASDYSVSGVQSGVANAYLGDSNAIAFSGTPSVTSAGSAATAAVAGSPYAITAAQGTLTALDGYALAYNSAGTLTVNPAALTVTANDLSKTYGTTKTYLGTEFTTTGTFYNGDSVGGVTLTSAGTAASATVASGPYSLVPSAATGTGLSNYTISYVNGILTVNPAALTITANNLSKTYGTTKTYLGTEFTTGTLYNGDSVSGVTLTSAGSAATATVAGGPYSLVASAATGTGLSNYTISYANGILTVDPAALTITANNINKPYGTTIGLSSTGFSSSGLLNGDTISSVLLSSAGAASNAAIAGSPYIVTPSAAAGTGLSNYNISYVNGVLTVIKGNLVIAANNESKLVGTTLALSGSEFTASGLSNTDLITSVTLTSAGVASTAKVGIPYTIVPSAALGTFDPNNYTITYNPGVLIVNDLPSTVTWVSQNGQILNTLQEDSNTPLQNLHANKPQIMLGLNSQNKPVQDDHLQGVKVLGGILHIDPALVKMFNLEYLEK